MKCVKTNQNIKGPTVSVSANQCHYQTLCENDELQ